MSTISREWLLKTIAELEEERDATPGAVNEDAAMALAAMIRAKASLQAEAVYQWRERYEDRDRWDDCSKEQYEGFAKHPDFETRILYTGPPAPVVDADDNFYSWFGREWYEHYQHNQYTTAAKQMLGVMAESAWKAGRRAAMLQGAKQTNYRAIVERIAEIIHGKVTDIDLLTVTVKSMKDKLQK